MSKAYKIEQKDVTEALMICDKYPNDAWETEFVRGMCLAYNQLANDRDDLKAKYQKAVEALKFYADKERWTCEEGLDGYLVGGVISSSDQETFEESFDYGGKLARQTLADLGET